MSPSRSRALLSLLALWLAVIAVVTLSPTAVTPPLTLERFLCVGCRERDTADIIANWILFLPAGALAAKVLGGMRGVVLALTTTALIETLQIGIPGRSPALQDLLFNTLGGATGAALALRGLGPGIRTALAVLATAAWLSPVALLVPMTSSSDLYGLWTPNFIGVERYRGEVLQASAGGRAIRTGLVTTRAPLDSALVERRPIELLLAVGPPPTTIAPVFQIVDGRRTTLVSLAARGEALTVVGNNPARVLRFDQPAARWPEAMAGLEVGDTVRVVIDRSRSSTCMTVGPRTACNLAPSLADGWGHLASLEGSPAWLRGLASILWAVGLGVLLGAGSTTLRAASIRGAGLATAGLLASALSPDVRPDALHAVLLAVSSVSYHPLSAALRRSTRV